MTVLQSLLNIQYQVCHVFQVCKRLKTVEAPKKVQAYPQVAKGGGCEDAMLNILVPAAHTQRADE